MPNIALITSAQTVITVTATGNLAMPSVDGFPAATHKLESLVGGEPVERETEGGTRRGPTRRVTDHVSAAPARLTLEAWASDFDGADTPAQAWEQIRRLQSSSEPVTVLTEWGAYDEMVVRRAEAPQRDRGGVFTIELEEILRVGVVDSDLPAGAVAGGPAEGRSGIVHRGRVPLEPPG